MKPYIYAFALLVTLAVGRLLWPLMRQSRLLCFWVLASGLSLIPIASTFTMDRLLVFVGIGASGALAMLFGYALQHPPGRWAARGVGALVVLHLVLSPMALPVRSLTMNGLEMINDDVDRSIPETENLAEKSLVVMQALSDGSVVYAQIERAAEGRPRPRSLRLLSTGLKQVEVTRLDAQTLHLRPERGFYETEGEQMGRHPKLPFKVGDEVVLKDMRVKVTHVDEHGRAMEAEFRFQSPLESPEWLWTHWVSGKLTPWRPPAIGETVILPPIL